MLLPSRLRDTSFALDVLAEISDKARIQSIVREQDRAIAGHSFGAGIASMKAGVALKEEYRGPWGDAYDGRFDAVVLLSAPGGGEELADEPYRGLVKPLMATGGTADVGRGYTGDVPPGDFRRILYRAAPPGDKYSVIIEDADHYLGGLLCNPERGGDPDPGAVAIVGAMTTAFFDAYLKGDPAARRFLDTADVAALTEGRVDYRRR